MAMGSAGAGLGAGLGTLFAVLGRDKLNQAKLDLTGAQYADQHALRTAQAREANSKAGLNEDQLAGLGGVMAALQNVGYTDPQATLMSTMARANGGTNLKSAIDAAMTAQIPVAGSDAVPQLGDVFQRALGRHTANVTDGVAYNPLGDADQATQVTPVGQSMIAAREAQAQASRASADNSTASAARTRLLAPLEAALKEAQTTTAHGGNKPTLPPISQLGTLLGQSYDPKTGLVSIPQDAMQTFLAWQAKRAEADPRYNNGNFALQHYATEAPLGAGVHDAPSDVGALDLGTAISAAAAPPASAPAPAAPAKADDGPTMPASQAAFDALPSGALFINPADGRLMRKK